MNPDLVVVTHIGIEEATTFIAGSEVSTPMPFSDEGFDHAFGFAIGPGMFDFGPPVANGQFVAVR
jgi:hypothetical protein